MENLSAHHTPDRLKTAIQLRKAFRNKVLNCPTTGLCPGFHQANLLILNGSVAEDFSGYCQANIKACPLLAKTEVGIYSVDIIAKDSDLRTDLPLYRLFGSDVTFVELDDIRTYWKSDSVGFLLGCSFSFEHVLAKEGLPPRHWKKGKNVSMYRTNIETAGYGPFSGPLIVSMRPYRQHEISDVIAITSKFPLSHGSPIHVGPYQDIGIKDLMTPDWGDPPELDVDDIPVFWACGVTSQQAALEALKKDAISSFITHSPGYMFITDTPIL